MGRLDDQRILITGGASGLGAAIVERYLTEGARICVLDRSAEGITEINARSDARITGIVGDVRSLEDNQRAVAATLDAYGGLDCVVGNAGIWDYNMTLLGMPEAQMNQAFDELFHINVLGYMLLAKAALKPLVASRGSMIFTVSNAGFLPNGGGPLYTATKHAVVGLIRQLAFELAPEVRVNGVAPGAIATQLKGASSLGQQDRRFPGERLTATSSGFVPVGQMPTPEEYAGAWVFFASREDNIPATGTILNHDGGFGIRGLGTTLRGGDDLRAQLGLDD